jgi:hypothetical protein
MVTPVPVSTDSRPALRIAATKVRSSCGSTPLTALA